MFQHKQSIIRMNKPCQSCCSTDIHPFLQVCWFPKPLPVHLPFNFSSRNSHLNFEAITTQNTNDRFEFETQPKLLTNKSFSSTKVKYVWTRRGARGRMDENSKLKPKNFGQLLHFTFNLIIPSLPLFIYGEWLHFVYILTKFWLFLTDWLTGVGWVGDITNFWSIVLDDHWSWMVCRPQMIVRSGAIVHP